MEYRIAFQDILIDSFMNLFDLNIKDIDDEINNMLGRIGKLMNADRCYIFFLHLMVFL
jgi:hypothetical protein